MLAVKGIYKGRCEIWCGQHSSRHACLTMAEYLLVICSCGMRGLSGWGGRTNAVCGELLWTLESCCFLPDRVCCCLSRRHSYIRFKLYSYKSTIGDIINYTSVDKDEIFCRKVFFFLCTYNKKCHSPPCIIWIPYHFCQYNVLAIVRLKPWI